MRRPAGGCAVGHDDVFAESGRLGQQRTVGSEAEGRAVEDQAVVAAHLVGKKDGKPVPHSDGGEHLLANPALAMPEGRGGDVDEQRGLLAHQVFDGIDRIERLGQKFLSFQASSQMVMARRSPSNSRTRWVVAGAK
jgi:hypothetical protein